MNPLPTVAISSLRAPVEPIPPARPAGPSADDRQLRETFDSFVGGTFYGQMLKALRSTEKPPAYFHGGQAEEIFRDHLDQVLAERMSQATARELTGPMFDLFQLQSRS
jgi:Rod binding domain-containing protein